MFGATVLLVVAGITAMKGDVWTVMLVIHFPSYPQQEQPTPLLQVLNVADTLNSQKDTKLKLGLPKVEFDSKGTCRKHLQGGGVPQFNAL